MITKAYPNLFSSIQLGSVSLRNRVVQSSLSSLYGSAGQVTSRLIDFYRERARGGAGAIVSGALVAHSRNKVPTRIYAFDDAHQLEGLKRWADAVESEGCRLLGQIVDPGRGRNSPGRSPQALGASALPDDLSWTMPHVLTADDIRQLVDEMAGAALRLQRSGFSGVEISCGHGHLFHQFLSPQANNRQDVYGGDLEGRTRFVRDLCAAIRSLCGDGFILGLKVPGDDGVPGGIGLELAAETVARIARDRSVNYFSVAQGAHHRSLEMHVPDRTYPSLPYRHLARRIRTAAAGIPVGAIGRITTGDEAESLIASGDSDFVMIGRALLADAGWVNKMRDGRANDVRLCVSCNTCWGLITAGQGVGCDVNPRLGTAAEADWQPQPAKAKRRVTVVGAGVAGLEAAWIAAARGHDVTVLGASGVPGGKSRLNGLLPGSDMILRLSDYQRCTADKYGVRFQLGRRAELADVLATRPDVVVLATGSQMAVLPSLAPRTANALDARTAALKLLADGGAGKAGTAVLFDCDHTEGTYDLLSLMYAQYERVVLATPREGVAGDTPLVVRQRIQRTIQTRRIFVMPFHELERLEGSQAVFRNVYSGDLQTVQDVTLLVYSTHRIADDALVAPLKSRIGEVHVVGDAHAPRTRLQAVEEGHRVANTL